MDRWVTKGFSVAKSGLGDADVRMVRVTEPSS